MTGEKHKLFNSKDFSIFILPLALLGFIFWGINSFLLADSEAFVIKSVEDGVEKEEFISLDSDKTIKVTGKKGEMLMEFSKEKGARVASSMCPSQICVYSGWSKTESLICVPNAVVVSPKIKKNDLAVDAVTR